MHTTRALGAGILGALAMSTIGAVARAAGQGVNLEEVTAIAFGWAPGRDALLAGLGIHLVLGAIFGLLYGLMFEFVFLHGGASTGLLTAVVHASLVGMLLGFAVGPSAQPGPYFAARGLVAVACFFIMHAAYGAVVGAIYGHVEGERAWSPSGKA
jgi:hypothetical protein